MEKSRTTNLSLPNALDILTSLSIKLSVMLSQWSENQNLPATFGQITYFNSDQNFGPNQLSTENNTPESQEILKFMLEIHKVVNLSLEASVLILEYLDRYFHNQVIAVFELNWKQVLLASILSAKKAVTYFCSSELSSWIEGSLYNDIFYIEHKFLSCIGHNYTFTRNNYVAKFDELSFIYKSKFGFEWQLDDSKLNKIIKRAKWLSITDEESEFTLCKSIKMFSIDVDLT